MRLFGLHIFLSVLFLCLNLAPHGASAQTAEPVVTPWSIQNTDQQTRIRQYQNFKSAQSSLFEQEASSEPSSIADLSSVVQTSAQTRSALPPPHPQNTIIENISGTGTHPSTIEQLYSNRTPYTLEQFGYDLFGVPNENLRATLDTLAKQSPSLPSGAVQDSFVLNTGDELEILFTGQRTDRGTYTVNAEGLLLITDFPPIPAAGRTIGQVRISIEAAAQNLYNTTPYVSLSSVRQISILVAGHVKRPGRQTLSVFHTVLDALMETGGVQKTGSLRRIKLIREGKSTTIDLYSLLLGGTMNTDLQLRDGDRIIIPPLGPSVAIAGEVKRPGIFEIQYNEKLSLNSMLLLGGDLLTPGKNRFLKLEIMPNGQEQIQEIHDFKTPVFGDGSILLIEKGLEKRSGMIELQGHTRRPGLYALSEYKTLSALLSSTDIMGPDIYPLIGLIDRWDSEKLSRTLLDFSPQALLRNKTTLPLQEGDIITLFSHADIAQLNAVESIQGSETAPPLPPEDTEKILSPQTPSMVHYLEERAISVKGAVRNAGMYPVADSAPLENLLAVAGGPTLAADLDHIEHTTGQNNAPKRTLLNLKTNTPDKILIKTGDSVLINPKFSKNFNQTVLLLGEVKRPGRYDLIAGDKLSDLLKRAGGLTEQAYPLGAIFSRETERKAEEARFHAQARNMEQAIASALEADDDELNVQKIAEARALATELREAKGIGRLTVESNPEKLEADPALDLLLEANDRIFIPKRTLSVRVSGEVLSPASLQFQQDKTPDDYIREAGGFTYNADRDRMFVLYPNGAAQPVSDSSWKFDPVKIPPGSILIVPRDPKPFDFMQSAKDISQILSNLAVTAIFVDDLKDD